MSEGLKPTFPNFAGKHAEASMFSPQDFLAYAREHRGASGSVPVNVIMCYSPWLGNHVAALADAEILSTPTAGTFHVLGETNGQVGVAAGFGIGAPAASTVLEELIACGARKIISIGAAGTLQRGVEIGETMLCTAAIRDEGVSHHYLEPGQLAHPSAALTQRLGTTLSRAGIEYKEGTAWTIDAPYRETVAEAHLYQSQGVLAVEMEAAALFAIAIYREVEAAAAFIASDSLAELTWAPRFGAPEVRQGLERLLRATIKALLPEQDGG
ncbi:MAG: nucleoside phosphorylase [Actinomycetota bacterium]